MSQNPKTVWSYTISRVEMEEPAKWRPVYLAGGAMSGLRWNTEEEARTAFEEYARGLPADSKPNGDTSKGRWWFSKGGGLVYHLVPYQVPA